MKSIDVIVVGAGPAGSSAAATLGAMGKRVLLLDRNEFPREKTCGDGLTHKCLPHLERLGILSDFLSAVEMEIFGYSLFFSNDVELTMRNCKAEPKPFAYIMPRYTFDNLLVRGALRHSNVVFQPKTRVSRLLLDNERIIGVEGVFNDRVERYLAPLVIDASGANSALAVQVGGGNRDPEKCAIAVRGYFENVQLLSDTIELYFDPVVSPGYFWIFPTSPTTANVGCGTFQHIVKEKGLNLREVLGAFAERHPVARRKMGGAVSTGRMVGGKIPLPMVPRTHVRDGLILTGDSAAFVDPLTAEGISFSMHSGIRAGEVAGAALDAEDISARSLQDYDSWRQEEYGARFARSIFFSESLPKSFLPDLVDKHLKESGALERASEDLGYQYELAVKVKALLRAI